MKKYPVVYLNLEHPSFSHNNGIYFLVKKNNYVATIAKIDDKGQAEKYPDDTFVVSQTAAMNLVPTNMIFETDEKVNEY